ncbi:MAG TPA: hypothetical protein VGI17_03380 [Solirubrobacterales bacterium]
MDATSYRRRQRRRAIVGWSVGFLVVAIVALGVIFGGDERHSTSEPLVHLFSWEMTSAQYEHLHKGEGEPAILKHIGTTGLAEEEVPETELLTMFPPAPPGSTCNFWKLSDAPDHLVRLCFSEVQGVLLQKAVRAPGESGAEATLA